MRSVAASVDGKARTHSQKPGQVLVEDAPGTAVQAQGSMGVASLTW